MGVDMQIKGSVNQSSMTGIHSRSIKPENTNVRLKKLNPDKVINETKNTGVELTISKDAKRLLEQHLGSSAEQILSSGLDSTPEAIAQRDINDKAMAEFYENPLVEWQRLNQTFLEINRKYARNESSAFDVLAELSNKYDELRESLLEGQLTGEALEVKLNFLKGAFNWASKQLANYLETRASDLLFNQSKMMEHQNISFNRHEFEQTYKNITEGTREAVLYFAQLVRQFVLENGRINSEQDKKALEAFLNEAPRQQGSLSFNNFNSLSEILQKPYVHWHDEIYPWQEGIKPVSASETTLNRRYLEVLNIWQQV